MCLNALSFCMFPSRVALILILVPPYWCVHDAYVYTYLSVLYLYYLHSYLHFYPCTHTFHFILCSLQVKLFYASILLQMILVRMITKTHFCFFHVKVNQACFAAPFLWERFRAACPEASAVASGPAQQAWTYCWWKTSCSTWHWKWYSGYSSVCPSAVFCVLYIRCILKRCLFVCACTSMCTPALLGFWQVEERFGL